MEYTRHWRSQGYDDKDDSHDELDIDTNDSDLQSNEDGDEASKKSTILFTNNDSDGPEVFAVVNNDDLKPSTRHTVLPPPPCMPFIDNVEEEEEEEEEEVISVNHPVNIPNDEETSLMMKAFTNKSSTSNVVSPNPALADKLISMIKTKFKDGAVTLSLKDPGANMRTTTNKAVIINTWVRSGNELVTRDPNNMGPTANLTRSQVLAAGFRKYGDGVDKKRVCLSYAIAGLIATAYLDTDNPSPLPLIIDLVPAHTQTEFNKKSGSARIDAINTDVAELIIQHVFAAYDHAFFEGWDNINILKKVIHKLKLVSIYLSDATIGGVIDDYHSPRARYDLEDSLPVILVFNRETKKTTIIFTCMQISLVIGGPTRSNRMSGKMYIPIIHELVCAFLDVSGAENQMTAISSFTTGDVTVFRQALSKEELSRSRRIFVGMACCQSQLNSCHQARQDTKMRLE